MFVDTNILAIAARGENGEIGQNGELPWHHPADLKRFRNLTMGDSVVVGRVTWEKLPELDGRSVHVLSNTREGEQFYDDINDALVAAKREDGKTWVIGGESVYEQTLHVCSHLALTEIPKSYPDADAYLKLGDRWEEVYSMPGPVGMEWRVLRQREA